MNEGLKMTMLMNMSDADFVCRGPIQGYKIYVHKAGDTVHISRNYIRLAINQELSISVNPIIITTPDSLRAYSPEKYNEIKSISFKCKSSSVLPLF